MKEKQPYADYKCHQIFGFKNPNEKIQNEDLVSVVKFDQSGSYIALGDKAGRIVIFKALSLNQRE